MRPTKWIVDIANQVESEMCPNCLAQSICNSGETWCEDYGEKISEKIKEFQENH